MAEENEKKRFETRIKIHPDGSMERKIYIGGELFDWSVDVSSFMEAKKMGPKYVNSIQEDIAKHFVQSVSEFLGRKVTAQEVFNAAKTGWI
jgi:carbon monoxide dehydrogenase subunit G